MNLAWNSLKYQILALMNNLNFLNIISESLITIPSDSIINFPLGSIIYLNQSSTGQVSVVGQQGVIINSDQNILYLFDSICECKIKTKTTTKNPITQIKIIFLTKF